MSSIIGKKGALLALLALGFAIASSAISLPTAAFASSGYDDKNGNDNCGCDNGDYHHKDTGDYHHNSNFKDDDNDYVDYDNCGYSGNDDHKGGYDDKKGDKSYDHHGKEDNCGCNGGNDDHKGGYDDKGKDDHKGGYDDKKGDDKGKDYCGCNNDDNNDDDSNNGGY